MTQPIINSWRKGKGTGFFHILLANNLLGYNPKVLLCKAFCKASWMYLNIWRSPWKASTVQRHFQQPQEELARLESICTPNHVSISREALSATAELLLCRRGCASANPAIIRGTLSWKLIKTHYDVCSEPLVLGTRWWAAAGKSRPPFI